MTKGNPSPDCPFLFPSHGIRVAGLAEGFYLEEIFGNLYGIEGCTFLYLVADSPERYRSKSEE